ncbi:BRWD3 [Cordylochernes scorpioides]|uniref:BRWD3 n=1 Tax=Cordylochernes scorpioides TaxID=51811 RepID=A0ABY6LIK2_9ARAC|nr:BRWD3 [Cordylochernes scorpioides]
MSCLTGQIVELYYLITQFLAAGPCKKTALLLKEELEEKQEQLLGRALAPDHLLQLCLRLPPLVDREVPSNISGVATLLGVGCHSVLRRKEGTSHLLRWDYMLEIVNYPLSLFFYGEFRPRLWKCSTLNAREYSGGVSSPLSHTVPTQHYSKQQRFRRLLGHLSSVYCVLFDRSGHYIFTGADDNLVKIWSAHDGRLLATMRGHSGEISDLAVNFENTVLASGSCDKMIRVWCLRSLAPIAILTSHTGMVTSVRFCPYPEGDPRYLISTGNDGCVCFWSYSPRTNTFK